MVKSLLEILAKWSSQTFYLPIDVYSLINAIGENIFSCGILRIG